MTKIPAAELDSCVQGHVGEGALLRARARPKGRVFAIVRPKGRLHVYCIPLARRDRPLPAAAMPPKLSGGTPKDAMDAMTEERKVLMGTVNCWAAWAAAGYHALRGVSAEYRQGPDILVCELACAGRVATFEYVVKTHDIYSPLGNG